MNRDDAPRTQFHPNPGGYRTGAGAPPPRAEAASGERRLGVNPLVDSAGTLLELAVYLRGQTKRMDAERLRENASALLLDFEHDARRLGCPIGDISTAHFAICATIDDVILNSNWGQEVGWQMRTLASMHHGHVQAGEKFFDDAERLLRDPTKSPDLLELFFICLSLGFRGKYNRDKAALPQLEHIRERLYTHVGANRRVLTEELSANWRGEEAERTPPGALAPTWLIAALAAVAVVGMFIYGSLQSSRAVAAALDAARDPAPRGVIEIARAPMSIETPPLAPPPPDRREMRLTGLLQNLIDEKVIDAPAPDGSALRIRVRSVSDRYGVMFASGEAEVRPPYREVLRQIAAALSAETVGDIWVVGHSDLQPLSPSHKYRNNTRLSAARAQTAATLLIAGLTGAARQVYYQGKGEAEPIAQGADAAAHARNRRIDILIPNQIIQPAGGAQ